MDLTGNCAGQSLKGNQSSCEDERARFIGASIVRTQEGSDRQEGGLKVFLLAGHVKGVQPDSAEKGSSLFQPNRVVTSKIRRAELQHRQEFV